jgi:hypothetical protein
MNPVRPGGRLEHFFKRLLSDLPADPLTAIEELRSRLARRSLWLLAWDSNEPPGGLIGVGMRKRSALVATVWAEGGEWHGQMGDHRGELGPRLADAHLEVPDHLGIARRASRAQLREILAQDPEALAEEILGPPGRMISSSKSDYRRRHPDHLVAFNGRVLDRAGTRIWQGDLDVSADREALQRLANEIGPISVKHESPAITIRMRNKAIVSGDEPIARFRPAKRSPRRP